MRFNVFLSVFASSLACIVSASNNNDYMDKIEIVDIMPNEYMVKRDNVTYPQYTKIYYNSTTTETERPMNIILPNGYDETKQYPVLYYLHGILGDEDTMLVEDLGAIAIYTNLLEDQKAKEMIIVAPNEYAPAPGTAVPPSFDQSHYDGYDNFINDLVNDIMPYMEQHYPILTGRENTALLGFSMGGRNSLYIGYTRSDLFGYIGAVSPAPGIVEAEDMFGYHKGLLQPEQLVAEHEPIVSMVCGGTNDTVVGTFPRQYHEILETNNQKHIWFDIPGADHDITAITTGYYNFMASVFGILNDEEVPSPLTITTTTTTTKTKKTKTTKTKKTKTTKTKKTKTTKTKKTKTTKTKKTKTTKTKKTKTTKTRKN